jgi:exonuclease 3'-5' domain-containing protein 1
VRNDSDALFSLYGINLKAVYDIQLLEVAFRRSKRKDGRLVKALGIAVIEYAKPDSSWTSVKQAGKALLFPSNGGSYKLFEIRPLDPRILAYAANDVTFLFTLAEVLERGLGRGCVEWKARVLKASSDRVALSHRVDYNPAGGNRGLAPIF